MPQTTELTIKFAQIVTTVRRHRWLVLGPMVVMGVLAACYAVLSPPVWQASQALLVRDEAMAAGERGRRPGQFDDAQAMQTAQETLLEIAKNRSIVSAALTKVGPGKYRGPQPWPTRESVEEARECIRITAPQGAEFGRTEVIYLSVRQDSRQRAIALHQAVCDELESHLQQVRASKAQSVIDELERTLQPARSDLNAATSRLEVMEQEIGADLGELRILNDAGAGDSNLRTALNQIKNELRQLATNQVAQEHQLQVLLTSQQNPTQLVATPNRVLEAHPGLRRLKDGLVDAQLRLADLLGRMNEDHPQVEAAMAAQRKVRQQLHEELQTAIRGVRANLQVSQAQSRSLETQQAEVSGRLQRLASLRARYGNLIADVRSCNEVLQNAQVNLADARASQSAAQTTSLITRLESPDTGKGPVGPGSLTVIACGIGGGLLVGLALVFLATPLEDGKPHRWSDRLWGRRWSDQQTGRRNNDRSPPPRQASSATSPHDTEAKTVGRRVTDAAAGQRREEFVARPTPHPPPPPAPASVPVQQTQPVHENAPRPQNTANRPDDRREANDRRVADRRGSQPPGT